MEDRVLGLKARENYEHPAATVLLTAHKDLEKFCLTRAELRFKESVDQAWGELGYMGLVDEPLFADLNAFIDATQARINGTVKMRLFKGGCMPVGRESKTALYSEELASFDDSTALDQKAAEGYAKFHGFQARLYKKLYGK
jgi:argininosuccinate synthase